MTQSELRDKIVEGGKEAYRKLIEEERKKDGSIVVSRDGKVQEIKAKDVKLPGE